MPETPHASDLELLGLKPGATTADLHRAYQRARATWGEGSLATYGLVDDAEREAILARLTMAYERLSRSLGTGPIAVPPQPDAPVSGVDRTEGGTVGPSGAASERPADLDPGAVLRARREAAGLDLEAVARETRVRRAVLEALERGDTGPLPAPVYIRGFVIAYAQVVGIEDPEALAGQYLRWLQGKET